MVLKSKAKIYTPKEIQKGGARVYIPAFVALDSAFPFKQDSEIIVEIDPQKKIVILRPIE